MDASHDSTLHNNTHTKKMINNILENSILDRATKAFQNNDGGRKKVLHFLIFFKSVLFAKIGF